MYVCAASSSLLRPPPSVLPPPPLSESLCAAAPSCCRWVAILFIHFCHWTLFSRCLLHTACLPAANVDDNAPAIPRLGIPAYVWLNDDVHGVNGPHATVFPDGCGLGASFDKDMMHAVGLALGSEARAVHNGFVHDGDRGADGSTYSPDHGENGVGITMYGPNINLVRDPRWGRSQETYGECPTLTGKLSIPFVRGSQGSDIDGVSLNANGTWLAGSCCKHYAAYDVESYPIDRGHFSANVTADDMFEYYLAPFHDCIATAEAMHVMTSLNAVNGVATSADPDLVDGILRNFSDSWNFSGFVVTDYGGWEGIGGGPGAFGDHGCDNPNARKDTCCKDVECSALKGVQAGLDSDGGGMLALQQIPKLVSAGQLSEERIAMSFRRLMRQRVRLGMFDPPTSNAYNRLAFGTVESAKHSELARTAAQKAICLYQNRVAKATTTMQQDELEVEVEGVDGAEGEGEDRGQNEEGTRAFWLASQNSNGTLPLNLAALSAKPHSVLLAGWTADDGDNLFGNYVQHVSSTTSLCYAVASRHSNRSMAHHLLYYRFRSDTRPLKLPHAVALSCRPTVGGSTPPSSQG